MKDKHILIIDETIREGMQFQGVMFSPEQRCRILDFQEKLKVDVCQAGYPPAHITEVQAIKVLSTHAKNKGYHTRIAAMGRANTADADTLLNSKADDLHFHIHIKTDTGQDQLKVRLKELSIVVKRVQQKKPTAMISIAMLDIGKCSLDMLNQCADSLQKQGLDILSLPDTSGILAPNQISEKIGQLSGKTGRTRISVHCHNDRGMATANGVMGIAAGADVLEASALGIGERNGISDLYTTGKALKEQGFAIRLNTDDIRTFSEYYRYVDCIVYEQTGIHLLNACTPVFGKALSTHVAGTHADGNFGQSSTERFALNALCGKQLVKKYLALHDIHFSTTRLSELTLQIKKQSAHLNRPLGSTDIKALISRLPE